MTSFDDKEKAVKNEFAFDEAQKFKITIKRNKLLALWAAGKIQMTPQESELYVGEIIEVDFMKSGIEHVVRKVYEDLKKAGVGGIPARDVLKKLEEFEEQAKKELVAEIKKLN